ncbi:coenzyme F420-0:L-glutamate ligase [Salinactinospora qingdaonensis]|uniref:Coenzyme F420-0:L-glutamate ligase n=1 Tax=Salinactinospora qingdaonensis TaxID=702744 RepID=A0ABP7FXG6_9ACTN
MTGIGEVQAGDDLAGLLARAARPRAGDIIVVSSKVVSKAEGRTRRMTREAAIDAETVRVVAQRGTTRIVQNRHGMVMAAAGVDASNVEAGHVLLLPEDPDASARRLRHGLREQAGVDVGVVITDTFGRPWRVGQTDIAIGVAGLDALEDLRGHTDTHGNVMEVTLSAIADEIAAAGELVKGKASGVPAAVVRGLEHRVTGEDGTGAAALIRSADADLFRYGSRDVVTAWRTTEEFTAAPVDPAVLRQAIAATLTAPTPHGPPPWRFVVVESAAARQHLLDELSLPAEATGAGDAAERADRDTLAGAPSIVVVCLAAGARSGSSEEPDPAALLSLGAAVQNLLLALTVEGLGSAWLPAPPWRPASVRTALRLAGHWQPLGAVAVGHPADRREGHLAEYPPQSPEGFVETR